MCKHIFNYWNNLPNVSMSFKERITTNKRYSFHVALYGYILLYRLNNQVKSITWFFMALFLLLLSTTLDDNYLTIDQDEHLQRCFDKLNDRSRSSVLTSWVSSWGSIGELAQFELRQVGGAPAFDQYFLSIPNSSLPSTISVPSSYSVYMNPPHRL